MGWFATTGCKPDDIKRSLRAAKEIGAVAVNDPKVRGEWSISTRAVFTFLRYWASTSRLRMHARRSHAMLEGWLSRCLDSPAACALVVRNKLEKAKALCGGDEDEKCCQHGMDVCHVLTEDPTWQTCIASLRLLVASNRECLGVQNALAATTTWISETVDAKISCGHPQLELSSDIRANAIIENAPKRIRIDEDLIEDLTVTSQKRRKCHAASEIINQNDIHVSLRSGRNWEERV